MQADYACPSRIVAERRLDQAVVGIIDYEWSDSFIYQDENNSVHYRLEPFHLGLRGTLTGRADLDLGNLSLLPAGSTLRVSVDPTGLHQARTLRCLFAPSWIERLLGQSLDLATIADDEYLGIKNGPARSCLHRIALELLEPGFASDSLVQSMLQTAVIHIIRDVHTRHGSASLIEQPRSASTRLSSAQLRRILSMIEDCRGEIPDASALADALGMSVSHFRRLFRATTGQSVHEFISDSIAEQAKSLLANSRLSMKEITYRLGFTSPSSFSVAFRRMVGCSPTQFRTNART